jgi:hypothetical protein
MVNNEYAGVEFYTPSMHPYCSAVVTGCMRYTDELVRSMVSHEDIARLNLWVLSRVPGDFSYPYGIEGSNMMFSIDERGLVRQIPTVDGWISGNVGGAFEIHAGLKTDAHGIRTVEVCDRYRERTGPHLVAVIDAMHRCFARDGFGVVDGTAST